MASYLVLLLLLRLELQLSNLYTFHIRASGHTECHPELQNPEVNGYSPRRCYRPLGLLDTAEGMGIGAPLPQGGHSRL
ncbi:hypothetical protein GGR53DRAFT_481678 [Hypoxylon sp. FL1150]|nr:hypothetical protein GGR53DRAFT_481678 [Hypoxylon sp. FL1150]